MSFFKLVMIVQLKIYATGKVFGKMCLKAIRDTFFPICGSVIRRETGPNFWWGYIQQKGKVKTFGLARKALNSLPYWDILLSIRKTLRRVLGLLIVMILKIVSESVFFQSNNFTACKFKDQKDVANSLMGFNLLKIIHPFQGKDSVKFNLQPTKISNWQLIGLNTNSSL